MVGASIRNPSWTPPFSPNFFVHAGRPFLYSFRRSSFPARFLRRTCLREVAASDLFAIFPKLPPNTTSSTGYYPFTFSSVLFCRTLDRAQSGLLATIRRRLVQERYWRFSNRIPPVLPDTWSRAAVDREVKWRTFSLPTLLGRVSSRYPLSYCLPFSFGRRPVRRGGLLQDICQFTPLTVCPIASNFPPRTRAHLAAEIRRYS